MSDSARSYVARAPRYVLRPDDNQMIRYALPHEKHNPYQTKYINISQTGLAFIVSQRALRNGFPLVGDNIKVEVPVPGGDQFAWWAKIIRIEEYENPWKRFESDSFWDEDLVMVAVRFDNLPVGHAETLRVGLVKRFDEIKLEQAKNRRREMAEWWALNYKSLLLYIAMTLLTFAVLYWLSIPDANYDAHIGSPWGQRFRF